MINASNNIVGGKRTKRTMKGGEESWGATGMPAHIYGAKLPIKYHLKLLFNLMILLLLI